jgi:hypothetical protein
MAFDSARRTVSLTVAANHALRTSLAWGGMAAGHRYDRRGPDRSAVMQQLRGSPHKALGSLTPEFIAAHGARGRVRSLGATTPCESVQIGDGCVGFRCRVGVLNCSTQRCHALTATPILVSACRCHGLNEKRHRAGSRQSECDGSMIFTPACCGRRRAPGAPESRCHWCNEESGATALAIRRRP